MEINKIYNENCLKTMERMEEGFIDLTVTSPPYDNLRAYNDNIDESWNEDVWKKIIKELYRVTKDGGVVVWIVSDATIDGSETGTSFRQCLYAKEVGFNIHDTMIWAKDGGGAVGSNYCYTQNFEYMFIWSKGRPKTINLIRDKLNKSFGKDGFRKETRRTKDGEQKGNTVDYHPQEYSRRNKWWVLVPNKQEGTEFHPAVFPEQLVIDHIKSWSNEGDLIYDPFSGSGTTAKCANVLSCNFIGSELSEEYWRKGNERISGYINQEKLF